MTDHATLDSVFARNTEAGTIHAAIDRKLAALGTPMLVQVQAVHGGGVSLVGTVDVQPMVHQQDGQGRTYPHGVINGVPYLRVQGGTSALIIDPQPGDIGFIMIAGRDISDVVASRKPAAPGSFRMHSLNDCVYVGGFLNNAPDQFVMMTRDGIRIVTTGTVHIEASSAEIACDLSVQGRITATGDIRSGGISLQTHRHGGVASGSGTTGTPQ